MRRSRLAIGLVLALIGLVWLGQGSGLVGGSTMSGSSFWAIVGIMLLVVGAVVVLREVRSAAR